ncbi:MAG: 30S ribosomal protein S16 [Patescibacteria group bacterium]
MLTIRFNRVGKRNKAYFRIVLQEHTIAPGGKHIEILGSYDPHLKKAVLKAEKIKEWIKKGAQASDSAYNLFIKEGVLEGKKRAVKIPKKVEPETAETVADDKKSDEGIKPEESKAEEVKKEEPKKELADTKTMADKKSKQEEVKVEDSKTEETIDKK